MGSIRAASSRAVTLTFSIGHSVAFGERIYVIGSAKELGEWEVSSAVPLKWHAGDVWTASVHFSPPSPTAPTRLEYKFVVAAASGPEDGSGPPLWEPGHNHALDLAPGVSSAQLSHTWGDAASHDALPTSDSASALAGNSYDHTLAASFCSPPPTPAHVAKNSGQNDPVSLAAARLASSSETSHITAVFRVDIPVKHREDIVYVVGSVPSLASWNKAHSPRMRRVIHGDNAELSNHADGFYGHTSDAFDQWELTLSLPLDELHSTFEYKYLVREKGSSGERLWEPGPNRIASLPSDKPAMVWRDRWDRVRWEFSIFYPTKPGSIMHVTGDPLEIGGWFKPGPVAMQLGDMERIETDVEGRKWKLTVWLPRSVRRFSYRYMCYDSETKASLWEREPNREANMVIENGGEGEETEETEEKEEEEEDSKEKNGGVKKCSNLAVMNGGLAHESRRRGKLPVNTVCVLRDVNFVCGLLFDEVPPSTFIGPYPQTTDDIDTMAVRGVSAVLNLQTDEDFAHRGIQWSTLMSRYNEQNMSVVRFPIRDFDRDSLNLRINGAVHELDRLIQEGKKVYVHCTAGMGRAPAVVVAYLCWVHNYTLDDAVAHVKKYRAVAVPNVSVLRVALQQPY